MAIDIITTRSKLLSDELKLYLEDISKDDISNMSEGDVISKFMKQDMFLMKRPLDETYKQHYSRSLKDNIINLQYEERPYTFLYFVPPDCTGIDYDFFDVVNSNVDIKDSVGEKIKSKTPMPYSEISSLPIDLKTIHPEIRKMLLQQKNFINSDDVKGSDEPDDWNITIPVLNNFFIADSITSTDIEMTTTDTANTMVGFKHVLPLNTIQSRSNNTFSVDFQEVSSKSLGSNIIANLSLGWMRYIQHVRDGTISPTGKYTIAQSYDYDEVLNTFVSSGTLEIIKGLHYHKSYNYMGSLYYFQLKPDGKTISYWSKWTGIYPININTSNMANNEAGPTKTTVTFQSQYFEELDYELICEFNELNLAYNTTMNSGIVGGKTDRIPTITRADANVALISGNIHPSKDIVMELYVGDEINNISNISSDIILSDMLSYEKYSIANDKSFGEPSFDIKKSENTKPSPGSIDPGYSYESIK